MSRERRQEIGRQLDETWAQLTYIRGIARDVAIEDHAEGVPIALIARELGVSKQTVHAWIERETK